MSNNIKDYLNSLETRKKNVIEAQHFIDKKRQELFDAIKEPTLFIGKQEEKIQQMQETEFDVDMKTVIEELAKLWKVTPDDLQITFNTNAAYSSKRCNTDDLMSTIKARKNCSMHFFVIEKDPKGMSPRFTSFSSPLILDKPQADGKPLINHVQADVKQKDNKFYVDLMIDDYKNIVIRSKIENLISFDELGAVVPKDDRSSAIINAIDRNHAKDKNVGELADNN